MSSPGRAHEVVLRWVSEGISEGRLSVGDRLPAERDLAEQLSVSRPAVREALRVLEAQGVVSSHVGSGTNAGTHLVASRADALTRLIGLHRDLEQTPLSETMVLRLGLERTGARLAALSASDEDLQELAELQRRLDNTTEPELYHELNEELHTTIARLSGNRLCLDLVLALRSLTREPIDVAEATLEEWAPFREAQQLEHRRIIQALVRRDARAAADAMEEHILFLLPGAPGAADADGGVPAVRSI